MEDDQQTPVSKTVEEQPVDDHEDGQVSEDDDSGNDTDKNPVLTVSMKQVIAAIKVHISNFIVSYSQYNRMF